MDNIFSEEFAYITKDNIIEYIKLCAEYILENINGFKQEFFPDSDILITYGDAIENCIEPYLRILSDDKNINEFDSLFMLKYKSITDYASKFNEITSYNSEFERVLFTVCMGLKRVYRDTLIYIMDTTTIDDYEEVDNVICEYLANEFYTKRKKIMFEHNLDPLGSKNDYDRMLLEHRLIIEFGELCAKKGIR